MIVFLENYAFEFYLFTIVLMLLLHSFSANISLSLHDKYNLACCVSRKLLYKQTDLENILIRIIILFLKYF